MSKRIDDAGGMGSYDPGYAIVFDGGQKIFQRGEYPDDREDHEQSRIDELNGWLGADEDEAEPDFTELFDTLRGEGYVSLGST